MSARPPSALKFTADGNSILLAMGDGSFCLLDSFTGTRRFMFGGSDFAAGEFSNASLSACGTYVASGNTDGAITVWSTETGTQEAVLSGACLIPSAWSGGQYLRSGPAACWDRLHLRCQQRFATDFLLLFSPLLWLPTLIAPLCSYACGTVQGTMTRRAASSSTPSMA